MKKTISIILCICLLALSFASCKGAENKNNATIADSVKYTYDAAYSFNDAVLRAYNDLCKSVIAGESEVRINSGFIDDVFQLFYTSFPLSAIVKSFVPENAVYRIEYKSKEPHADAMLFLEKINQIKSEVYSENKTEYAIKLYSKIASMVKISENSAITCYETVMKGEGTSFSYSNMFEYLLAQNDIKAYHILCEDENGASRAMSMAEIDGELYYFDVFRESEDNGGKLLRFFGMITDDIEAYGIRNVIYTNRQSAANSSDLRFDSLRNCKKYEIKDDKLLVTDKNGEIVQIAL